MSQGVQHVQESRGTTWVSETPFLVYYQLIHFLAVLSKANLISSAVRNQKAVSAYFSSK